MSISRPSNRPDSQFVEYLEKFLYSDDSIPDVKMLKQLEKAAEAQSAYLKKKAAHDAKYKDSKARPEFKDPKPKTPEQIKEELEKPHKDYLERKLAYEKKERKDAKGVKIPFTEPEPPRLVMGVRCENYLSFVRKAFNENSMGPYGRLFNSFPSDFKGTPAVDEKVCREFLKDMRGIAKSEDFIPVDPEGSIEYLGFINRLGVISLTHENPEFKFPQDSKETDQKIKKKNEEVRERLEKKITRLGNQIKSLAQDMVFLVCRELLDEKGELSSKLKKTPYFALDSFYSKWKDTKQEKLIDLLQPQLLWGYFSNILLPTLIDNMQAMSPDSKEFTTDEAQFLGHMQKYFTQILYDGERPSHFFLECLSAYQQYCLEIRQAENIMLDEKRDSKIDNDQLTRIKPQIVHYLKTHPEIKTDKQKFESDFLKIFGRIQSDIFAQKQDQMGRVHYWRDIHNYLSMHPRIVPDADKLQSTISLVLQEVLAKQEKLTDAKQEKDALSKSVPLTPGSLLFSTLGEITSGATAAPGKSKLPPISFSTLGAATVAADTSKADIEGATVLPLTVPTDSKLPRFQGVHVHTQKTSPTSSKEAVFADDHEKKIASDFMQELSTYIAEHLKMSGDRHEIYNWETQTLFDLRFVKVTLLQNLLDKLTNKPSDSSVRKVIEEWKKELVGPYEYTHGFLSKETSFYDNNYQVLGIKTKEWSAKTPDAKTLIDNVLEKLSKLAPEAKIPVKVPAPTPTSDNGPMQLSDVSADGIAQLASYVSAMNKSSESAAKTSSKVKSEKGMDKTSKAEASAPVSALMKESDSKLGPSDALKGYKIDKDRKHAEYEVNLLYNKLNPKPQLPKSFESKLMEEKDLNPISVEDYYRKEITVQLDQLWKVNCIKIYQKQSAKDTANEIKQLGKDFEKLFHLVNEAMNVRVNYNAKKIAGKKKGAMLFTGADIRTGQFSVLVTTDGNFNFIKKIEHKALECLLDSKRTPAEAYHDLLLTLKDISVSAQDRFEGGGWDRKFVAFFTRKSDLTVEINSVLDKFPKEDQVTASKKYTPK